MQYTMTKAPLPENRKRGLTLGEVAALVQMAYRDDAPADARVSVEVGFRGQIKRMTIHGDRGTDA